MPLATELRERFNIHPDPGAAVIALAGNPNTGKSTIFNALTGLKQHTGNWPGKTVLQTQGTFHFGGKKYILVDLPGTYSLLANSAEEIVTRDFLCFARPDATVVVTDATCLERNLNLALQVMEITSKVIVCVNFIDEARRKNIFIDVDCLARELGVPVVVTAARNGLGLTELKAGIDALARGQIVTSPRRLIYDPDIEEAVARLEEKIPGEIKEWINARWLALRIIDHDRSTLDNIRQYFKVPEWGVLRERYKYCPT
ncbi:FeoB small GTPase domain-containing protein [Desulfofundulus thermosubterraneus]|uniref:Ferrous iron transport protein B n=1 Tax=Desulfofundulus thermosubterraneus DSM 16057 TaxID=1121432 RepID=A0A1M6EWA3_9FIRM|nr:FeoB small GTPase domain-containing protein [Desulfofundulus thermosubterraneus]SHI89690.1 Ferrous iron transport protein B [Desulfofundulus thermosubterraneus DSM 16057]